MGQFGWENGKVQEQKMGRGEKVGDRKKKKKRKSSPSICLIEGVEK